MCRVAKKSDSAESKKREPAGGLHYGTTTERVVAGSAQAINIALLRSKTSPNSRLTSEYRMLQRVTPMIHVPDVAATVEWYRGIGFTVDATYGSDGPGLSFAILSFGRTQVMFNQGGKPSTQRRREVDLYIHADDVDGLFARLKDQVEVVEGLHDTFYGMREFIIRDLNRFWITCGQETAYGQLMGGIREGDADEVRGALDRGGISSEFLTNALVSSTIGVSDNSVIAELLRNAGAVLPPMIESDVLEAYAGYYRAQNNMEVVMRVEDGQLFAVPKGAEPIPLVAITETSFRPLAFDGVSVTFRIEGGRTVGFQLKQGSETNELKRV